MSATPLDTAVGYIRRGWAPVPVPFRTKGPILTGWKKLRLTEDAALKFFDGQAQNIGVLTGTASGGLVDVDLDCPEAITLAPAYLPGTGAVFGRPSKRRSHRLYRIVGELQTNCLKYIDPEDSEVLLELRANQHQTVFPGSVHEAGEPISWDNNGEPEEGSEQGLKAACGRLAAAAMLLRVAPGKGRHDLLLLLSGCMVRELGEKDALAFLTPLAVAMVPDRKGKVQAELGRMVADAVERLEAEEPVAGWPKLLEAIGSKRARQLGEWLGIKNPNPVLSDDAIALQLGEAWEPMARHVALWGRWLFWTGSKWEADEKLLHVTLAREFMRSLAAKNKAAAEDLGDARTIMRVISLARSNKELVAGAGDWDADLWKLNTPAGIVDLRTGILTAPDPQAYCTKTTTVAPAAPGTPTPVWDGFLARIFRHDSELIPYIHRVLGYALTGLTTEHVLIFSWGEGGNGKSVLFNTAAHIFGDYAATAPADMFLVSHGDRHPTDMAMLRGARLVSAQEMAPGRAWDASKLKTLTGGDPISARFMRQDFFTYEPQFTLSVAGNHKPSFRGVDWALRRRVQLVPFLQNIPEEERDRTLEQKLKAEWPGILQRLIEGCLDWQQQGLNPPKSVRDASQDYLDAEDVFGQWLDECCMVSPSAGPTGSSVLFASWKEWCEAGNQPAMSQKAFSQILAERGFPSRRGRNTMQCWGIRLRTSDDPPAGGDDASETTENAPPCPGAEDAEDVCLSTVIGVIQPDTRARTHASTAYKDEPSASSAEPSFHLITDLEKACKALADLGNRGELVGLDLETTGLDPLTSRARLLQLAPADGPVLVIDLFAVGGLESLREAMSGLRTVAHNATFDASFLRRAGIQLVPDCTMLMSHILTGKREKLSELAERHLGRTLDKTFQKADWAGELSQDQLAYAAEDARTVRDLHHLLQAQLESPRLYEIVKNAQAAVVEMETAGMPFDGEAHLALVEEWQSTHAELRGRLQEAAPGLDPSSGPKLSRWLSEALGNASNRWPATSSGKQLSTTADDVRAHARLLPEAHARIVLEILLPLKALAKLLNTHGPRFRKHIHELTGRIHASFNLAGTITGRMSSARPNMQNIPCDRTIRGLFKPSQGRVLVVADYSQMELRVAAHLANEKSLLQAFREGQDTHALTASMLLGKKPENVTKAERQMAKAVNFGLLYGQGSRGLKEYAQNTYGVSMTFAEADRHRDGWFKAYPAFKAWHRATDACISQGRPIRTPAGRTRAGKPKLTEALNMPVQGGAAEAMIVALGRFTRMRDEAGIDATLIATVHDELLVETTPEAAQEAKRLLEKSMIEGMLTVFPDASTNGLVEANVCKSWADK